MVPDVGHVRNDTSLLWNPRSRVEWCGFMLSGTGQTWRCCGWAAARSRTAVTTSSFARHTTPRTGGATFCCCRRRPTPDFADHWLGEFAREFPTAGHVAFGFDAVQGTVEDLAAFAHRGLSVEAQAVMTASTVHEPPRPNKEASYRALTSDAD